MRIRKISQSLGFVGTVINNLNSDSETDALSAKQGKKLAEMIQRHIVTGEECATNEYVDGKQRFVRRYETGPLPNQAGELSIDMKINASSIIIDKLEGTVRHRSTGTTFPFNFSNPIAADQMISLRSANNNKFVIYVGTNRSDYDGYIEMTYRKL